MTAEQNEDRGFKVEDKRRFAADGADAAPEEAEASQPPGHDAEAPEVGPKPEAEGKAVGFTGFVVGLASQALACLGALPAADGGATAKNLPEASALIDILAMLQAKTVGNLTDDESRLLEDIIYDLRMRYVAESRAASSGSDPGAAR